MRESFVEIPLLRALDNTPWRPIHTRITVALGVAWLLDAFEVAIIGSILPTITEQWGLSNLQGVSLVAIWLFGILVGAQVVGILADRFGRRRLFLITLFFYATFTFLSAFSVNYEMLMVLRFLTAIGVGAEYSAINAAISEFIPARHRGRANAAVMSFWGIGGLLAAGVRALVLSIFPTPLRSTGVGFSVSVGRIGAAIASIGLVEVAAAFNLTAAFGLLAAFWVLGAAAMVFWARSGGPDGAKVPLERLEPDLQGRVP